MSTFLSIIIVNYNVRKEILECIQSIKDKIHKIPYEVIVSDNGSTDGSINAITERFPWVKIIGNNKNLGFGKANNIGAEHAKGNVLFFLNPDTLILNGIEDMSCYLLEHAEVGLTGPLIYDANNNLQFYHKFYAHISVQILDIVAPPLLKRFFMYKELTYKKYIDKQKTFIPDIIHGSAMMFTKQSFSKIGGFDNNIFLYDEETDISLRLRKSHYIITTYPRASIYHLHGRSSKYVPNSYLAILWASSLKYIFQKYHPSTWLLRYLLMAIQHARRIITGYIKIGILFIIRKNYSESKGFVEAEITNIKACYKAFFMHKRKTVDQ